MPATSGARDIELQRADGTWIGLMLSVEVDAKGVQQSKTVAEILAAQDPEVAIHKRLESKVDEDWSGGVGVSYNVAPGCYTRTPGYALPAGASVDVTVTATNNSASNIPAISWFGGDAYVAQIGAGGASEARVMRSASGTGALANSLNLAAVNSVEDLIVFPDQNNAPHLYASGNDINGGRMHRLDTAPSTWTSTVTTLFGTNERRKLAKAFWVIDGIGAWRMQAVSGVGAISYTKPNTDPMLAASWVEGVRVGSAYRPTAFAYARRHVWAAAPDGLFDLDEQGNSPNIYPAAEQMYHPMNGYAAVYHDGYVYYSLGMGLARIYVDSGIPAIEENVGQCAPGWGTAAEHEYRGWCTALCVEQGFVCVAVYNPTTQRTGIWWGKDRRLDPTVQTANPLIWYGPEIISSQNLLVTAMRPITAGTAGALTMWIAASAYDVSTLTFSGNPTLSQVSLPISGAPLDDLISGGPHRFTLGNGAGRWQATSELRPLKGVPGDRASKTILYEHTLVTRGLGGGTKLTLRTRADAAPGVTTYTTTDDITTSPTQSKTPAAVVQGQIIDRSILFVCSSTTAVGVLDACRMTYWKIVPSFGVRTLAVEYGDGVVDLQNGYDDTLHPDTITADLVTLTGGARTTLRDRNDRRWPVKVEQVLTRQETLGSGTFGKTVKAQLEVTVLGAAL